MVSAGEMDQNDGFVLKPVRAAGYLPRRAGDDADDAEDDVRR